MNPTRASHGLTPKTTSETGVKVIVIRPRYRDRFDEKHLSKPLPDELHRFLFDVSSGKMKRVRYLAWHLPRRLDHEELTQAELVNGYNE